MRGENPERHEDSPQCGYYKRKIVKNGPWVPCEIICERVIDSEGNLASDERMIAVSHDGATFDAAKIWTYLTPITVREFQHRMASLDGLATHAPVDLTEQPARP